MASAIPDDEVWLPDEDATRRLAEDVAMRLRRGDLVALSGGLGAGKSSFARSVLRALANDTSLEVPSPTFTLAQTYALPRFPVTHFDLYRLSRASELDELGFEEALADGAVLVEWPERAPGRLPAGELSIELAISGAGRVARISGGGDWPARLARTLAIRDFLDGAGWEGAARRHLQGDASTRAYERIHRNGETAILMDAPARGPSAPIAGALPYDVVAHLARDMVPFVAVGEALRAAGYSAPALLAHDLSAGLLLLEDLGSDGVLKNGAPDPARYRSATLFLAALHGDPRPAELPLPDGGRYRLPPYDEGALAIETELLLEWYAPHRNGARLSAEAEDAYRGIWARLIARLAGAETSWVLRDFHSPNLVWLARRRGHRRVGLLDYQDALLGPGAYDLASLLQDARVTVPEALETELLDAYCAARRTANPAFDEAGLRTAYRILATQRAAKVLGIFCRLDRRDGKPAYLRHLPRVEAYFSRNLADPVLSDLALWYETHIGDSGTGESDGGKG